MTIENQMDQTKPKNSQDAVTEFYDNLIFPSATSHNAYEALVPTNLQGKKVGDFGCGQSLFQSSFEKQQYDAVFLDIAPKVITAINYGEKIQASLTDIPLPDNHMDYVFCIGVVHHIPEMEKAISELIRVTKPGGRLILGVYAPGTAQAKLRVLHDGLNFTPWRKLIRGVSRLAIWIKNRRNGLKFFDEICTKRVDDLLITPVVRYAPVSLYDKIVEDNQGKIVSVDRISQMNILEISPQV